MKKHKPSTMTKEKVATISENSSKTLPLQFTSQVNTIIRKAIQNPKKLSPMEAIQLQKALGNKAVCTLLTPSKSIFNTPPIQLRNRNPYNLKTVDIGGWSQTAHHVVPLNLIETLYKKLEGNDIATVETAAGAAGDDYQWPTGNLFYGPNTSIRAEPGEKEEFDYDAKFFMPPAQFSTLLKHYNSFSKLKTETTSEVIKEAMVEFYKDISGYGLTLCDESKWKLISSDEEIEKVKKVRPHIDKYVYYTIDKMDYGQEVHPDYPEITCKNSYYYYKGKELHCQFHGNRLYIQIYEENQEVKDYIREKKDKYKIVSYLPSGFVENTDKVANIEKIKNTIKEMSDNALTKIDAVEKISNIIHKPMLGPLSIRYNFLKKHYQNYFPDSNFDSSLEKINITDSTELSKLNRILKLIKDFCTKHDELLNIAEVERGNCQTAKLKEKAKANFLSDLTKIISELRLELFKMEEYKNI